MARTHLTAARLALGALALGLTSTLATAQGLPGEAPDGQPGLWFEGSQSDLLRPFRSRDEAVLEELVALRETSSEVRLLIAGAMEGYRGAGFLDLLGPRQERSLPALHAAFFLALEEPRAALVVRDRDAARAFARMALDERFLVRAKLLADFELDAQELESGLAVLEGAATSFVVLSDEELRAIATRVDLAASRLRAMRSDLLALRNAPARKQKALSPDVKELLAVARMEDGALARIEVGSRLATTERRAELMERALFSARLEQRVEALVSWRERLRAEALVHREQAFLALPGGVPEDEVPEELRAMRKHDRLRLAGMRARQGLAVDPLDAELAFVSAHAADFQWGSLESRPLYDRFLLLSGIRHDDHRSMKGRSLDEREQEALIVVQAPVLPRGNPPPKADD